MGDNAQNYIGGLCMGDNAQNYIGGYVWVIVPRIT